MMRNRLSLFLAMLTLVGLQGCAGLSVERYSKEKPTLDLAQYFQGRTTGWGMVTDRSGEVTRRFVVQIDGHFVGTTGVLDEVFDWSDGEKQRRIWRLEKIGPNRWRGTADDVVGEARVGLLETRCTGDTHWRYP